MAAAGMLTGLLAMAALVLRFALTDPPEDPPDDEKEDPGGGGGRGGGNDRSGPRPRPSSGTDPEWWPEFEREFAAFAERERERAPVGR